MEWHWQTSAIRTKQINLLTVINSNLFTVRAARSWNAIEWYQCVISIKKIIKEDNIINNNVLILTYYILIIYLYYILYLLYTYYIPILIKSNNLYLILLPQKRTITIIHMISNTKVACYTHEERERDRRERLRLRLVIFNFDKIYAFSNSLYIQQDDIFYFWRKTFFMILLEYFHDLKHVLLRFTDDMR